jgi:hypothetical protein
MDFWPRMGLHQKSYNVISGKETYVGWGVRASSWWSMATQPQFWRKLPRTTIFNIMKANIYGFLPRNGLHQKSKNVTYGKETYVGMNCTKLWSMVNGHSTPIFVENSHEWPFSIIPKANTYGFFYQEMVSTRNPRMLPVARKYMWGDVYKPLVDDQWPQNPHFCRK